MKEEEERVDSGETRLGKKVVWELRWSDGEEGFGGGWLEG